MKNIAGGNSNLPGSNGKLLLYNSASLYQNKFAKTNSSGIGTFSDLSYGDYIIEAYHNPTGENSTIFGEEFWGSKKVKYSTDSKTETVVRNMPYFSGYKVINTKTGEDVTGGSVAAGTELRIEITALNPNINNQKIKARLVIDRDKLSSAAYDFDKLSEETSINAKAGSTEGTKTINSLTFIPAQSGEYYSSVGIQTNTKETTFSYTDGTKWSKFITVTPSAPTGNLTITVKNVPEGKTSLPGSNGEVELFNSKNERVEIKPTDANGVVTFSNITTGEGYYFKVFNKIQKNLQEEYWGTQRDIVIKANTTENKTFTRNQPYGGDIRVFNGATDVTGQTVEPGTNLKIKYTITNPSSSSIRAKGTIYLDESKFAPWEISPISLELQTIPAKGKITLETNYTTQRGGTFYAYGLVNIESISENGSTVYTDNTVWGDEFLFKVTISRNSQNLIDALVNLANNRKDENGNLVKPLKELYKENQKVFAFVNGDIPLPPPYNAIKLGTQIYIDLADVYSYLMKRKGFYNEIITEEGSEGWVTVWINGKVGVSGDVGSILGYSAKIGITPPATIEDDLKDPKMKFDFSGSSAKIPFLNASMVESDMNGESWGEIKKTNTVDFKVSIFELGFNIFRFEINIDELNSLLNNAFKSSLEYGELSSTSSNNFLSSTIQFDESGSNPNINKSKLIPNKSLRIQDSNANPLFRPFSSTDNNKVGVDGVINFLNGGMDKNNDKIKDNFYPVIPNVYGLNHTDNQAELTFQNTGNETADFYIKIVNVPTGWIVDSEDKRENILFPELRDYRYDLPDAPTAWNRFHYTFWTIGCIDALNAPDNPELTFELWHNKNGFDKLLQTKKLTVHKQKVEGNISPTISGLKATVKSENPTKNIEISWTDSDPDDDATIAIAIDFDKLGEKPWEASGIHRWIATDINETSVNNIFNWDITGIPTGTYSLWAVIYDGKNQPQYVKSNNDISISSLFDPDKPYVKIYSNKIEWVSFNKDFNIDFFDNTGLNNAFYQLIPKDLNKNATVANYSLSEKYAELLLNESNWNFLTSNGTSILPESQFSLKDSLTEDWKISNTDWQNMESNSGNGESFYLFLKATDDAGNIFISKDESEAVEIKIDIKKPNVLFTYPNDGQRINTRTININWTADDITDGIELSGIDSIYLALDNPLAFQNLSSNATGYTLNNLSDGIHKVYLKAKDKAGNFSDLELVQFSVNSDFPLPLPEITNVSGITMTKVQVSGNIKEDYNTEIISKGFCWSTTPNPTIMLSTKTEEGAGKEIFLNTISGLSPGSTYYLRCYATNCTGTAYSEEIEFTTNSSPGLPIVITTNISEIESVSAASGGYVISDGDAEILTKGICWSTNPNPTVNDSKIADSTGSNSFKSFINGLNPGTTYYVRAYATNIAGTGYGEIVSFTTNPKEEVNILTDYDENEYSTVTIGNQIWMGQNLKTTTYNDGTPIPLVTSNNQWGALNTPAYCWYNNDVSYKNPYGALYNWYAVSTGKLCPLGWHVPTDENWTELAEYLGGLNNAGGELKETGSLHWDTPNEGATNSTNFTGLPGGFRSNSNGAFVNYGISGAWWSSTEDYSTFAWNRSIWNSSGNLFKYSNLDKSVGLSVRCICDYAVNSKKISANKSILVYPNPTTGIITIKGLPENENAEIALYNMNSKLVKVHTSHLSLTQMDISDIISGVYLLVINKRFEKAVKIIKK